MGIFEGGRGVFFTYHSGFKFYDIIKVIGNLIVQHSNGTTFLDSQNK